jgi:hypothetical protein
MAKPGTVTGWKLPRDAREQLLERFPPRYEDVIADPATALAAILSHAGIESSPALIASMIAQASSRSEEMEMHRTTPTQDESIGRWRRDLPPELQAAATVALARPLAAFGYTD